MIPRRRTQGAERPTQRLGAMVLRAQGASKAAGTARRMRARGARAVSVLRMHAQREHRDRAPIKVICRVRDELVVECDMRVTQHRKRVVSLDYLFRSRARELAVADQNAEAARVQIALALAGDAVEDAREADSVVGTGPARARER